MVFLIAGIAAFLIFTIGSRVLTEKAVRQLTDEQRLTLFNNGMKRRRVTIWILATIVVTFLALSWTGKVDRGTAMYLYFGAFLLYFAATQLWEGLSLRKTDLPATYIKRSQMAGVLRLLAMVLLVIGVLLYLKERIHEETISL